MKEPWKREDASTSSRCSSAGNSMRTHLPNDHGPKKTVCVRARQIGLWSTHAASKGLRWTVMWLVAEGYKSVAVYRPQIHWRKSTCIIWCQNWDDIRFACKMTPSEGSSGIARFCVSLLEISWLLRLWLWVVVRFPSIREHFNDFFCLMLRTQYRETSIFCLGRAPD